MKRVFFFLRPHQLKIKYFVLNQVCSGVNNCCFVMFVE
jgi:hypothetical protein